MWIGCLTQNQKVCGSILAVRHVKKCRANLMKIKRYQQINMFHLYIDELFGHSLRRLVQQGNRCLLLKKNIVFKSKIVNLELTFLTLYNSTLFWNHTW